MEVSEIQQAGDASCHRACLGRVVLAQPRPWQSLRHSPYLGYECLQRCCDVLECLAIVNDALHTQPACGFQR
jgi:hypothetical protein